MYCKFTCTVNSTTAYAREVRDTVRLTLTCILQVRFLIADNRVTGVTEAQANLVISERLSGAAALGETEHSEAGRRRRRRRRARHESDAEQRRRARGGGWAAAAAGGGGVHEARPVRLELCHALGAESVSHADDALDAHSGRPRGTQRRPREPVKEIVRLQVLQIHLNIRCHLNQVY